MTHVTGKFVTKPTSYVATLLLVPNWSVAHQQMAFDRQTLRHCSMATRKELSEIHR